VWSQVALHRRAEFNRSHIPAFLAGEEPHKYVCVYPFVRSYEWYLLPEDEGLRHIGFFQSLTRDVTGAHPFKTWPFRFSSIDASHTCPPPLLGEHNREVLTDLLGLSDEELARLEEERVIGREPLAPSSPNA
jgi:hypothetical protein